MSLSILKENDSKLLNCSFIEESKYFYISQFSDTLKVSRFKFNSFNVKSLVKKGKIESLLLELHALPDITAITETKLTSSKACMANIENYNFSHVQSLSNVGGVDINVRENLSYFQKTDINIDIEDCESLFIKIANHASNRKTNKTLIGVVYRHLRSCFKSFQSKFCDILHKLNHSNCSFLISDFNIDLKKQNIDSKISDYYSSGRYLLINKPTRLTPKSSTTLDHIYTNQIKKVCCSGILVCDVSDHFPVLCIFTNL